MILSHLKCMLGVLVFSFLNLYGFEKENITLRGSFDNSRIAIENKGKATVAFMGGSITEMDGYRPMLMDFLAKRYPECQFTFINAGISSTCSTTGAFRLPRDVLSQGSVDLFLSNLRLMMIRTRHIPKTPAYAAWKASFVR